MHYGKYRALLSLVLFLIYPASVYAGVCPFGPNPTPLYERYLFSVSAWSYFFLLLFLFSVNFFALKKVLKQPFTQQSHILKTAGITLINVLTSIVLYLLPAPFFSLHSENYITPLRFIQDLFNIIQLGEGSIFVLVITVVAVFIFWISTKGLLYKTKVNQFWILMLVNFPLWGALVLNLVANIIILVMPFIGEKHLPC